MKRVLSFRQSFSEWFDLHGQIAIKVTLVAIGWVLVFLLGGQVIV